jgi:PilZ domain
MPDLRAATRRRSLLGARIEFNNRSSTLDCLVRDLSATGARLALAGRTDLPEEFDLWIKDRNARFRAQVRWRRLTLVGVEFVGPPAADPPGDRSPPGA